MDSFVLKLVLTPTLIGAASLAGRRWGPAVSGWLVGFPFTSAPIALVGLFAFALFFLTLAVLIERAGVGPAFAAALALTLASQAGALWTLRRGRGAPPVR